MKNNLTIEDYYLFQDKNKSSKIVITFLLLLLIGIIIILCKFNFQVYEMQTLIKNNDDFLLIVDSRKISEIESNSYFYIGNKKYQYKITEIESEYSNVNDIIYQTIHISPYNYKTDSIITEIYFLKSNKSIMTMIIEFIKGGLT
jgi:non-ribosomal peptide synthetase component E (peptide arylation enzyme)